MVKSQEMSVLESSVVPGVGLAAVTTMSYFGFLAGPPLMRRDGQGPVMRAGILHGGGNENFAIRIFA